VALGGVGGTLSHWRTLVPGSVFTATVTPAANGRVTVSVPVAAARDDRGKANTASSNVLTATYDGTRPMVTITGPASKQSAPFEVLFLWSEPVMGFNPKSVRSPRCACRSPLLDTQWPESIAKPLSRHDEPLIVPPHAESMACAHHKLTVAWRMRGQGGAPRRRIIRRFFRRQYTR
jgi:hypothetical protein